VLSPLLSAARLAQGRALGAATLFDPGLTQQALAAVLVEDGITTSAIEGERLDLDAVRSSVAQRLDLPTGGLPVPPRAVDGLIDVLLDATRDFAAPLTTERLCGWQASLFPSGPGGFAVLHPVRIGALRGEQAMQVVSGRMGRQRIHFTAPPRAVLEAELARFLAWFNAPPLVQKVNHQPANVPGVDGLVRAGLAHLWFVTLHPFEDGNGRLARAITDMALSQDEQQPMRLFSLSAQILRERDGYYAALEGAQRGGLEVTDWLAWFLAQVRESANAAQQTLAHTLAKARFWLRHQATSMNERQRKVVNRLLDAGPQRFAGGMNTRKYMSLTHTSRATAYRELFDLVEKKCLLAAGGGGRSSGYEIDWQQPISTG